MNTTYSICRVLLLLTLPWGVAARELPETALSATDFGFYDYEAPEYVTGIWRLQLRLYPTPEARRGFWRNFQREHEAGRWRGYIFKIEFAEHPEDRPPAYLPPIESAQRELDEFFGAAEAAGVSPGLFFGVTLEEENILGDGQREIMDALARHLHERYGVKCYQWLSNPLAPVPYVYADGWIFDAYTMGEAEFAAHVRKFILMDKPVIPCLWGAEVGFDGYFPAWNEEEFRRYCRNRMEIVRSYNLPVVLFAVTREPYGSAAAWFDGARPELAELRDFFLDYIRDAAQQERPNFQLPAPEVALFVTPEQRGEWSETLAFGETYDALHFIDRCEITPLRHFRQETTGLHWKQECAGGETRWNFTSRMPLHDVEVSLRYRLPDGSGAELAVTDACGQQLAVVPLAAGEECARLKLPEAQYFSVTVRTPEKSGFALSLQQLSLTFNGEFRVEPQTLNARTDKSGERDWTTELCRFSDPAFRGSLTEAPGVEVGWAAGALTLRGVDGAAIKPVLLQAVAVPEGPLQIRVTVKGRVDRTNYAAYLSLGISTDGVNVLREVTADGELTDQKLVLAAEIREHSGIIYLHWRPEVRCGIATPDSVPLELNTYCIEVKPWSGNES